MRSFQEPQLAPHPKSIGKNGSVTGMSVFELHRHNALASAIVATIREPLIILDRGLQVVAASGAFYRLFQVDAAATQHCPLHELNGGQWNVPKLRQPSNYFPTRGKPARWDSSNSPRG